MGNIKNWPSGYRILWMIKVVANIAKVYKWSPLEMGIGLLECGTETGQVGNAFFFLEDRRLEPTKLSLNG